VILSGLLLEPEELVPLSLGSILAEIYIKKKRLTPALDFPSVPVLRKTDIGEKTWLPRLLLEHLFLDDGWRARRRCGWRAK